MISAELPIGKLRGAEQGAEDAVNEDVVTASQPQATVG
jgi:hypothetical protein